MIKAIDKAINDARDEISGMDIACFNIGGYTSPCIRHLLNNLGALSTSYLEIGVHRGSTFCAAMSNNPHLFGVAVDRKSVV